MGGVIMIKRVDYGKNLTDAGRPRLTVLRRCLALIDQSHSTLGDESKAHRVCTRTIYRDLLAIEECGYRVTVSGSWKNPRTRFTIRKESA